MALTGYERAYQQNYRLGKSGISTQASRRFSETLNEIRDSNLSRAEKSALREAAAQEFLGSGANTKTAITEAFNQEAAGTAAEQAGFSTAEKARYTEASQEAKNVMTVKALKGSDAVKFAADVAAGDAEKFNDIMASLTDSLYTDPDMTGEEVNDFILEWEDW